MAGIKHGGDTLSAEIRILTPDDAGVLKALRSAAAEDPSFGITPEAEAAYTPELLSRTLVDSYLSFTMGALVGSELAGMVGFGRGLEEGTGTLYGLFVRETDRRRGIARLLVEAFLSEVTLREVTSVSLDVTSDNDPAVRLYRSLGFDGRETGGVIRMSWTAPA